MKVEKVFKKLLGKYNYGSNFTTTTAWVKKNDPYMYDYLLDLMQEFVADESNRCDEEDLKEFRRGNWDVEYVFREGLDEDEIEILVTAGRNGQHIANQPAWSQEHVNTEDIKQGYTDIPIEKYIHMIENN